VLEACECVEIFGPHPIARVAIVPSKKQVAAGSHPFVAIGECPFGVDAGVEPPAEYAVADDQVEGAAGIVL
jgi:hypothetical protein